MFTEFDSIKLALTRISSLGFSFRGGCIPSIFISQLNCYKLAESEAKLVGLVEANLPCTTDADSCRRHRGAKEGNAHL